MENSISERIKFIVESLNITANSFAQELGVAGSVVYNIIKGRNKPSFDILDKIVSSFNVNPTFLLTGKGDTFISNDETAKVNTEKQYDTDEDYVFFLKQWDRINKIVEKMKRKQAHEYFELFNHKAASIARILDHYSLINQSISFLRFAPKNISSDLLGTQVSEMLNLEEELIKLLKPYEQSLIQLSKELDIFNETHDNIDHLDDDFFESVITGNKGI